MIWLNDHEVNFETFPNGETGIFEVCKQAGVQPFHLKWRYDGDDEFMKLLFLKRTLDEINWLVKKTLLITYMPYSRMDRTQGKDVAFTLKWAAEFINSLDFHVVWILEPHSDVTLALVDHAVAIYPSSDWVPHIIFNQGFGATDYLVFPDSGAERRYANAFDGENKITLHKKRKFSTTQHSTPIEFKSGIIGLPEEGELGRALIVDDLCSRGNTFDMAAYNLLGAGFKEVSLYVTHLEPVVIEGPLRQSWGRISRIYTTDAMDYMRLARHHSDREWLEENVTCYNNPRTWRQV